MTLLNIIRSEVRYQLKGIVFWIFLLVTVFFIQSQFSEEYKGIGEPQPPSANSTPYQMSYQRYDTSNLTSEEYEMQEITLHLRRDLSAGDTAHYGFITKRVKLNPEQKAYMLVVLAQLDAKELTYEDFQVEMDKIDDMLGGRSIYGQEQRKSLYRPQTYEQAVASFKFKVYEEGLTNAYGRLFADYLGITAGLFPVFIAAFLLIRDRKSQMEEFIRVRQVHPLTYVGGKYLAVVFLISLVYLLTALHPTLKFYQVCAANDWPFHLFGFLRYTAGWVLPTMFFTVALAMLVGEITGNGLIAVVLQVLCWFSSIGTLKGDFGLTKYVIRFNSAESYELLQELIPELWVNRLFYLGLAVILVLGTAWVWSLKGVRGKDGVNRKQLTTDQVQHQDTV